MSIFVFADNASTTLASGIVPASTTITVAVGTGALFPLPSAGQQTAVTVEDVSGNIEVMYCTSRSGDVLTVTRGQEGTSALTIASGSRVEGRVTMGMLNAFLQKNGGDTIVGTTTLNGTLTLGGSGSIQNGEFTGAHRGAPGVTGNQILVPSNGTSPATMAGSPILTTANLSANMPSGFGLVPSGTIAMWAGSSASIPAGWLQCNGTGGTPNLSDQFIVGAGGTLAPTAGTTGGSASTTTGPTDPSGSLTVAGHILTIAELPAHNHNFFVSPGPGWGGPGNAPYSVPMWSSASTPSYTTNIPAGFSASGGPIIQNTGSGAAHTHGFSGNLSHTHGYSLPPYYGLFFIQKS